MKARGSGNKERVCAERDRERERERERKERRESASSRTVMAFEDAPTEALLHDRTDLAPRRGGPGEADEGEASVGGVERINVGATVRERSDGGIDFVALEDRACASPLE